MRSAPILQFYNSLIFLSKEWPSCTISPLCLLQFPALFPCLFPNFYRRRNLGTRWGENLSLNIINTVVFCVASNTSPRSTSLGNLLVPLGVLGLIWGLSYRWDFFRFILIRTYPALYKVFFMILCNFYNFILFTFYQTHFSKRI